MPLPLVDAISHCDAQELDASESQPVGDFIPPIQHNWIKIHIPVRYIMYIPPKTEQDKHIWFLNKKKGFHWSHPISWNIQYMNEQWTTAPTINHIIPFFPCVDGQQKLGNVAPPTRIINIPPSFHLILFYGTLPMKNSRARASKGL
jgi:hypothetical protein